MLNVFMIMFYCLSLWWYFVQNIICNCISLSLIDINQYWYVILGTVFLMVLKNTFYFFIFCIYQLIWTRLGLLFWKFYSPYFIFETQNAIYTGSGSNSPISGIFENAQYSWFSIAYPNWPIWPRLNGMSF